LVRRKIAFSCGTLEDFSVNLGVKVIVEQFIFRLSLEHFAFPEQVTPQPMWLVNFKDKYNISHGT
jgi:hypothetical protein